MNRTRLGLIGLGLLFAAVPAIYFLNPFRTAGEDPRARLLGFTSYRMPARSMEPNIREGDVVWIDTAATRSREPGIGEIIVFKFPLNTDFTFVARVVAVGGSTIEMRQGEVWLDGTRLEEPWLPRDPITTTTINGRTLELPLTYLKSDLRPTRIPEQHYFVLGDNRGNSDDSRSWGPVPRSLIIGMYDSPR